MSETKLSVDQVITEFQNRGLLVKRYGKWDTRSTKAQTRNQVLAVICDIRGEDLENILKGVEARLRAAQELVDKLSEHDPEIPLTFDGKPQDCDTNCLWSESELPCMCPEAARQVKAVLDPPKTLNGSVNDADGPTETGEKTQ